MAGQVSVTSDLPTGQVNSLQACANLLNGLVTGQGAQGVDVGVVILVDCFPQDLSAAACQGVLFNNGALQLSDLLCGVIALDVSPAGVLVPVLLDFFSGTCLADVRHVGVTSLLIKGRVMSWSLPGGSWRGDTEPHTTNP